MSHQKNTTGPDLAQLPALRPLKFGGSSGALMSITEGHSPEEGLALAADLANGLEELLDRIDAATNEIGDPATCVELRVLSFVAGATSALVQSARLSIRESQEAGQ